MMLEVLTRAGVAAITSDRWLVVRACLTHRGAMRPFVRSLGERTSRPRSCVRAAVALRRRVAAESVGRPVAESDEIVVCPPNYMSLKLAKSLRALAAARKRAAGSGGEGAKPD